MLQHHHGFTSSLRFTFVAILINLLLLLLVVVLVVVAAAVSRQRQRRCVFWLCLCLLFAVFAVLAMCVCVSAFVVVVSLCCVCVVLAAVLQSAVSPISIFLGHFTNTLHICYFWVGYLFGLLLYRSHHQWCNANARGVLVHVRRRRRRSSFAPPEGFEGPRDPFISATTLNLTSLEKGRVGRHRRCRRLTKGCTYQLAE